ncbi:MAG: YebC/PmpR family DNA-binding transcriptional regulator [Oligoflexia bacterium]|nr:YebC/PmpR family DNA-binding transcriptional regulator [Oligoflexia bacterium]MBF0363973.1 YebC/PmpR family DNA-binding transcriptional regulator [Oligoflexia bacterium]
MAGHSKWKNIRDRKGAQDAKKGKVFSRVLKEITVAVKTGGGPDPETNPRLRAALLNARSMNMPKDIIERAIKRASGEECANLLEVTFEGYGPGGVAIFIECTTDNNTRTVGNLRSYFGKHGGSLGKDGCLQFVFDRKAVFTLPVAAIDEDDFTLQMIDASADDVEFDRENDTITVTSAVENFGKVQRKFEELKLETTESSLQRIPNDFKQLDAETFQSVMKLIEKIEDDDDVQKVYHNIEYSDELAKALE